MAKGLRCLISSNRVINGIKAAMTSLADKMIRDNPNVKVTVDELYKQFKKAGLDVDLQSMAAVYSDNFAKKIDSISNYHTTEELGAYANKTTVLDKGVKDLLIGLGFSRDVTNKGKILDWVKLMRQSESDLKESVSNATRENMKGATETEINKAIDNNLNALKGSWKEIINNALIKGQNELRRKDDPVTPNQKDAIGKIADLYAFGLTGTFKDDYANATRKAVGVSNSNKDAMSDLDELGKVANLLANSPYGTNSLLGKDLESQVNTIINKARYKDANGIYKFAVGFAALIDMVKLKVLANPINRAENYSSGKAGLLNTRYRYGSPNKEIKDLAFAYKRNLIRNGSDIEFGDVSNMFTGNNATASKIRQWINDGMSKDGENKFINWTFAQLSGTASLNGVDTYNKVINTWGRFISNMQDILVSKGMTKSEAQQKLHENIFGNKKVEDGTEISNWELSRRKARQAIQDFNLKSGSEVFKENDENVAIFANDIVKMELLNSSLVTSDELNAAWNAGYKSAGREMGHVANNIISVRLNKARQATSQKIDESVKKGNYTEAAVYILIDTGINKIVNAFLSGGLNWVVLKTEKQGLGIVSAAASRGLYSSSFKNKKNIANLTPREIEDHLYNVQKTKDKFTRGVSGLITNGIITAIGVAAIAGGSDDDKKERMRKFTAYMKDHYILNKTFNKIAPMMLAGYIAKMQQDEIGWDKMDQALYGKKEPAIDFALNSINKNPNYEGTTQFLKTTKIGSDDESKQLKGYAQLGKTVGSYLDLNPFPTKFIYDTKDIIKSAAQVYNEITGKDIEQTPYTPEAYESNWEATYKEYLKQSVILPR